VLDTLISLDQSIFMLLNSGYTFSFLDWFMPFITNAKTWMPIILIVWLYMLAVGDRKMRVLALALLVAVGCTDLICARLLKKNIGRLRPCSLQETATFKCRLLLPRKSSKSFPSNHAANTAAFAATIFFFMGIKLAVPFIFLAIIIGYSRIYVGVHFPADVLAGWVVGIFLAWLTWKLLSRLLLAPCPEPEQNQISKPAS
jgi:undecaprenyl-diphosphatase